jgi:hypothetical protein
MGRDQYVCICKKQSGKLAGPSRHSGAIAPPPQGYVSPFTGPIEAGPAFAGMPAYRYYGGTSSDMIGGFLSPIPYDSPESAISNLALPPGNTTENVCKVNIPAGTQIQNGAVSPNFGQPGGGQQIQLLENIPDASFQPLGPTGPFEPVVPGEIIPFEVPIIRNIASPRSRSESLCHDILVCHNI